MFLNAKAFNQPIGSWNVSKVTNMYGMFEGASSFNQPIGSWNTIDVTTMEGMFHYATAFNQPLGSWDVSNVINMGGIFNGASSFNQPIGSWNVSNVTYMAFMFANTTAFNQNIGSWNVGNVTKMQAMFWVARAFNQSIETWDVSKVTNMGYMFYGASAFNQPIGSWNVSNVTNMEGMFLSAQLSTANYDALLIGWSIISPNETPLKPNVVFSGGNSKYCNGAVARSSIISTYGWTITDGGYDCSSLIVLDTNGITLKWTGTTLPSNYLIQASPRGTLEWFAIVNNSTKSNITDYAKNIQSGITYFTPPGGTDPIPFNNIVTTLMTDMSSMCANATSFNQPIGSWDVSNVTDMTDMFLFATPFNQPIGSWDVSKVTTMSSMFYNTSFNQDIGTWNVSNVSHMGALFRGSPFNQDISNWNISNATIIGTMFFGTPFNQDISMWDVSSVTNMNYLFANTPFNQDISTWDVSNVTNTHRMFDGAVSFNQDISSWDVSNVTDMSKMFANATSFNQPIGSWNVSNVNDMRDMFYNAGLSTANYDTLLIGWSTISPNETPLKPNVTFSGGNSKYCNGATSRSILTSAPNNWTITDGGQDCTGLNTEVVIGTQTWTNKNLDVATYSDGTVIPQITDPTEWAALTTGAWCYYNNDSAIGAIYGKLYNWYAVAGIHDTDPNTPNKILAPTGWHIPSNLEWTTLSNYLGGESVAGGKMKETSSSQTDSYSWYYDSGATNLSGFSAKPASWRYTESSGTAFGGNYPIKMSAFWWSSTGYDSGVASLRNIQASSNSLIIQVFSHIKSNGLSVRCLRDSSLSNTLFNTIGLQLYPNPVLSVLNIKTDYNLINQPFTIIDGLGRVVLNGKINEVESTINVEQLSKGIYYLKISDKNASKFIKE